MSNHKTIPHANTVLLAMVLASSLSVSPAEPAVSGANGARSPAPAPGQSAPSAQSAALARTAAPVRYMANRFSRRAILYYGLHWGVDSLSVRAVESGEIIRFSYRVLDPAKAATLNDKQAEPALIDPQAGVKLVVPSLEKVGKLRQSSTPVAGKSYWMAFSNKGRLVKRGDRVSVVIGRFQANGLVVE